MAVWASGRDARPAPRGASDCRRSPRPAVPPPRLSRAHHGPEPIRRPVRPGRPDEPRACSAFSMPFSPTRARCGRRRLLPDHDVQEVEEPRVRPRSVRCQALADFDVGLRVLGQRLGSRECRSSSFATGLPRCVRTYPPPSDRFTAALSSVSCEASSLSKRSTCTVGRDSPAPGPLVRTVLESMSRKRVVTRRRVPT